MFMDVVNVVVIIIIFTMFIIFMVKNIISEAITAFIKRIFVSTFIIYIIRGIMIFAFLLNNHLQVGIIQIEVSSLD